MARSEFLSWLAFYELQPFDDYHRFYRPAAMTASALGGGSISDRLEWLQPPPPPAGNYSDADLSFFKAFGIKTTDEGVKDVSERGKSGIYAIVNKETGMRYIGQAVSIGDRWLTHQSQLRRGVHHCRRLQASWNKRGAGAFEFIVLEYVAVSADALAAREQFWFDQLGPQYNTAPAAATCIGVKHPPRSEEFRKRMSEMRKGFKHKPETIQALRQSALDRQYRHPPEVRARISAGLRQVEFVMTEARRAKYDRQRDRTLSEEHRDALLKAITGRVVSEETRHKIGEANKGKRLGHRHSEVTKEKMSAAHRGRSRPGVAVKLGGRKRPDHVVQALRTANDLRFAERRERLRNAIVANPRASIAGLARMTGCDRETVSKYRRQLVAQSGGG